jgi:Flp pilus assembly protein CpaB
LTDAQQTRPNIKLGTPSATNRSLWISICLGLVAALANALYISRVDSNRISVLKANTKLTIGQTVGNSDFTAIQISGEDLKEMKTLLVESKDLDAFSGVPLAETLEPGQVLMQSSFGFPGNRRIRDAIDANHRAIAIQVKDDASAVAYLVRPGDFVDVWLDDGGGAQDIVPGAIVKAVGDSSLIASDTGGREFHYRTVTIIVNKGDVGSILSKLGKGNVVLALQGPTNQ